MLNSVQWTLSNSNQGIETFVCRDRESRKSEKVSIVFFFLFFQTEEDFKLMKFEEECQQNYLMKTNSPSSHDTKLDEVKERFTFTNWFSCFDFSHMVRL